LLHGYIFGTNSNCKSSLANAFQVKRRTAPTQLNVPAAAQASPSAFIPAAFQGASVVLFPSLETFLSVQAREIP
jgi:hypothetical protein